MVRFGEAGHGLGVRLNLMTRRPPIINPLIPIDLISLHLAAVIINLMNDHRLEGFCVFATNLVLRGLPDHGLGSAGVSLLLITITHILHQILILRILHTHRRHSCNQ